MKVRKLKIAYLVVMFSMVPLLGFASPRESILLLGDEYRLQMLSRCESGACTSIDVPFETPPQGSSAADIANMAVRAKQVVLVVDVLRGPSLEMAEHITIARQTYVPRLSVMFGNLKYLEGLPDAKKILDTKSDQMLVLMATYDMWQKTVSFFHDEEISAHPRYQVEAVGLPTTLKVLSREAISSTEPRLFFSSGTRISSALYSFGESETFQYPKLSSGDEVGVWINAQFVNGRIDSDAPPGPGADGELELSLMKPVMAAPGSRFFLERNGRLIGAGLVVRIVAD